MKPKQNVYPCKTQFSLWISGFQAIISEYYEFWDMQGSQIWPPQVKKKCMKCILHLTESLSYFYCCVYFYGFFLIIHAHHINIAIFWFVGFSITQNLVLLKYIVLISWNIHRQILRWLRYLSHLCQYSSFIILIMDAVISAKNHVLL